VRATDERRRSVAHGGHCALVHIIIRMRFERFATHGIPREAGLMIVSRRFSTDGAAAASNDEGIGHESKILTPT
jgi:hypothetical protein